MVDESIEQESGSTGGLTNEEIAKKLSQLSNDVVGYVAKITESAAEVDKLRASANAGTEEVAGALQRATEAVGSLTASIAEIQSLKTQADEASKSIQTLRSDAKADQQVVKDLATAAETLEARIEENIARLDDVVKRGGEMAVRLESLLPGATSVGLAKSFMDRKNEFKKPKARWAILGLIAIGLLIPVGLLGEKGLLDLTQPTWQSIIEGLLIRLPVAGPLVWLAIYAGRHHFLAARLEEDYAYKEAVSRAFEGYKREMEAISEAKPDSDVLSVLCVNVLQTIAQPPGRLFDRKHVDITPLNAMIEALDTPMIQAIAQQAGQPEEGVRRTLAGLVSSLAKPFRK